MKGEPPCVRGHIGCAVGAEKTEPDSARWTQESKCHPIWVAKAVP